MLVLLDSFPHCKAYQTLEYSRTVMESFPVLETDRLRLRKPVVRDVSRILDYANNPKIEEMTLSFPYPYEEKDAISWLEKSNRGFADEDHFIFAICLAQSDEFMGGIGLDINQRFNRAELGFWIGEPFWNNGYVTEAVREVLRFGFETLELNKIYAIHLVKNPASGKVMVKNGMIKEAELKEHIKKSEEYQDVIQYRLTKREFSNWQTST